MKENIPQQTLLLGGLLDGGSPPPHPTAARIHSLFEHVTSTQMRIIHLNATWSLKSPMDFGIPDL